MLRRCLLLTIFGLAAIPGAALAQVTPAQGRTPGDDTQAPIRIGAVIFADWSRTLEPKSTDTAGQTYQPNAFNLTRAYINVTGNVSHLVSFRITPDITRETGAGLGITGSLVYRIKYAYAQFGLEDWSGQHLRATWVRFGIQQTPYIDSLEGAYRYRFQGTVFVERDGGLSSADAGISAHTNLPKGFGDVHVGVYNGEGYSKPEVNDQKAIMTRVTFRPFPSGNFQVKGLRLTGFWINDNVMRNAERNRAIFGALYEHKWFNAGYDYMSRDDRANPTADLIKSGGWSAWATPFFKEKGNGPEMLIRYDRFNPNKALSDGKQDQQRTIVGFAYWFPHPGGTATAALMLDYQQVVSKNFFVPVATQKILFVHGLINF